jgi:dolichyl-phosphate-mannose--protein O-mannosyl transferase
MVHTLFYSPLITALAAALMAMDGMQLVHSRTALLDLFLTFFVLAAVYFWHRNRNWLAGISLGLACATKWSALYFLIVIILISAYRIFRDYPLREMPRAIGLKFMTYVLLPGSIYISSWTGWFIGDRGWDRQWSTNPLKSLWHYHAEMLGFHTGLTEKHSYQANPWSWLVMGRPTSFFYAAPKGCGEKECAQEVLALGTPFLWWIGTIALVVVVGFWIKALAQRKNQPVINLIIVGLAAGYLPWFFFQKRT